MDILIFLLRLKCDTRPINIVSAMSFLIPVRACIWKKGIPAGYRHVNMDKGLEDGITPSTVYAPGSIRLIWAFGDQL